MTDTIISGTSNVQTSTLVVQGTDRLIFDPTVDSTLTMVTDYSGATAQGNLVIKGSATLQMRPNPGKKHRLIFSGIDESKFQGAGPTPPVDTDIGLWALEAGVLDLYGEPRVGWNRTGSDPTWKAGDELFTTPFAQGDYTTFAPYTGQALQTITDPSTGVVYTQEVFNLTRTVNIEGTAASGGAAHRAHIFIKTTVPQTIKYVGGRYLSPRITGGGRGGVVLGRWGWHCHDAGTGMVGTIFEGCVARDCGGYGFVPHMSDGITCLDCVAHQCQEASFWWDKRDLTNTTTWDKCLSGRVGLALNSFDSPALFDGASFALGPGTGNVCKNSVAAGNTNSGTTSGFGWREDDANAANPSARVWDFHDNIGHNNKKGHSSWINGGPMVNPPGPITVVNFIGFRNNEGNFEGAYSNAFRFSGCSFFSNDLFDNTHLVNGKSLLGLPADYVDCNFPKLKIREHTLAAEIPYTFRRCKITTVTIDERNHANPGDPFITPGAYDFVSCNPLECSAFIVQAMHPSSVYRVQRNDGTAYQVLPNGTCITIAQFDFAAVVPETLQQAVATLTPDATLSSATQAPQTTMQAVATFVPDSTKQWQAAVTAQGVAKLTPNAGRFYIGHRPMKLGGGRGRTGLRGKLGVRLRGLGPKQVPREAFRLRRTSGTDQPDGNRLVGMQKAGLRAGGRKDVLRPQIKMQSAALFTQTRRRDSPASRCSRRSRHSLPMEQSCPARSACKRARHCCKRSRTSHRTARSLSAASLSCRPPRTSHPTRASRATRRRSCRPRRTWTAPTPTSSRRCSPT
jgi:hypothetical protein